MLEQKHNIKTTLINVKRKENNFTVVDMCLTSTCHYYFPFHSQKNESQYENFKQALISGGQGNIVYK